MNRETQTYIEIMSGLTELADELDRARRIATGTQLEVNDKKKAVAEQKERVDENRAIAIMQNGGWSALGKNEKERELALADLLRDNSRHNTLARNLSVAETELHDAEQLLVDAESDADILAMRLNAVTYQARLHAAFLNYISVGAIPASANGNGYPTGKETLLTPDQTGL